MVGKASMHARFRNGMHVCGMFLALWLACLGSMHIFSTPGSNSKEFNGDLRFKEMFQKIPSPTSSSSTTSSNNLPTNDPFNNDNHSRGDRGGHINIWGIPIVRTYLKLKKRGIELIF